MSTLSVSSITGVTNVTGSIFDTMGTTANNANATAIAAFGRANAALANSTGTFSGALTVTSNVADSIGDIRTVPVSVKSQAYVIVKADVGKTISITTGGVWVPNAVFSAGDNITIYNNSNSSQSITPNSSVVMFEGGNTGNGGTKTLAGRGIATVYCTGANSFVITGAGLI